MRRYRLPLQSRDRAELRRAGQKLAASVIVGKAGLSEEVVRSADECLAANALIKVRLARECPVTRPQVVEELAARTESECPGQIGRTLLLYRPPLERDPS